MLTIAGVKSNKTYSSIKAKRSIQAAGQRFKEINRKNPDKGIFAKTRSFKFN
jgi:hypothetical protein